LGRVKASLLTESSSSSYLVLGRFLAAWGKRSSQRFALFDQASTPLPTRHNPNRTKDDDENEDDWGC
jgi:hypothetical protein